MTTAPSSPIRRSRLVRTDEPRTRYPLQAIEHADAILTLLERHLFLSNDQIELAVFTGGMTRTGKPRAPRGAAYAANTALRRLFDGGWIERVPAFLPGTKPNTVKSHFVNVLSTQGARQAKVLLRESGRTGRWRRALLPHPWQPLLHPFYIREFAIRGKVAVEAEGCRWWSWFDDRQLAALKKEHGARFGNIPDGFFVVTNPATGKHFPHFLEIDLGSQTGQARSPRRPDWHGRVESYLRYFERDFREQFGLTSLPVVLTVTSAEARLENLLAVTAKAGGGGRFWFTTLDRLFRYHAVGEGDAGGSSAGPDGPFRASIWRVPVEDGWRSLAARWGRSGDGP